MKLLSEALAGAGRALRGGLARVRERAPDRAPSAGPPPAFSPEPVRSDIASCYRLLLGREPDAGDEVALSAAIDAGWPLETLVRSVLCSREFRSHRWPAILQSVAAAPGGATATATPPLATAADVAACYRYVLGRGPDPPGWDAFLGAVRRGIGRDELLRGFLHSPEFRGRRLARAIAPGAARPVAMKLGFPFAVYDNDDLIGAQLRSSGEFEPHVTKHFLARLRPGDCVLDIGANAGYFAVLAGRTVGEGGAVYAFEPYPANVYLIHANARLNGLGNVRVFPFALGDRWDCLTAYPVDTNAGLYPYGGPPLELPGRDVVFSARLDDLLAAAPRVDVLKIDVEGYEHRALSGGAALLGRHRPLIFTELFPEALIMASRVSPEEYLRFLTGFGYELSVIGEDGSLLPCGRDAGRVLGTIGERGGHADLLAVPGSRP